jgi:hypothetical protein
MSVASSRDAAGRIMHSEDSVEGGIAVVQIPKEARTLKSLKRINYLETI